MTTYVEMVPLVRPYVQNCPRGIVVDHLRRACREFCTRSRTWEESLSMTFAQGVNSAQVQVSAGRKLVAVRDIRKVGATKSLCSAPYANHLPAAEGEPHSFAQDTLGNITLGPTPKESFTVNVIAIVIPSLDSTEVDDVVADTWGEKIALGASATLMMMRDTPWYDPNMGIHMQQQFNVAKNEANNSRMRSYADRSPRAYGRPFV